MIQARSLRPYYRVEELIARRPDLRVGMIEKRQPSGLHAMRVFCSDESLSSRGCRVNPVPLDLLTTVVVANLV